MPSASIGEATDASADTQTAAPVPRSCAVRCIHRPSGQNTDFAVWALRTDLAQKLADEFSAPTVSQPL
jgi:hypothetical protein